MMRRYLILLIFSLPFFYGCSLATQLMYTPEINRAESLLQQGRNREAAAIYKHLASLNTNQKNQFRLLAVDALIASGDVKQAKKYITGLNPTQLSAAQFNHLKLLQAQIAVSTGDAKRALMLFKSMQIAPLDYRAKAAYYDSLAFAYSLTNKPVESVKALILLDPYIRTPKKLKQHQTKILNNLMSLSEHTLRNNQPAKANTLSGWIALTRLFKSKPVNLSDGIKRWRKTYPRHPIDSELLTDYEKKYQRKVFASSTLAVFLPESGPYANAAQAVKEGLMTAYNLAKRQEKVKEKLRFYNTEGANIVELYHKAVNNGAKLIIGPLNKNYLRSLVHGAQLSVPVLALNHVEGLTHPYLYQFGLSPIDDAQQIAYKASKDGHLNALLLIPNSKKGERMGRYFTRHWQRLGGNIVNIHAYDPNQEDFSGAIEQLIRTNNSGQTADVVIMNAYLQQASSLNPHLRYKQTTANLPVYATSELYLGSPNSSRDGDLNGVTFCDVPWIFDQVYKGKLSSSSLYANWINLPSSYIRLVPLGIDAYHLSNHLKHLRKEPYHGATGKLTLGADNKINRELFCAQFVNGKPKLLNFTSKSNPVPPKTEQQTTPENEKDSQSKQPEL